MFSRISPDHSPAKTLPTGVDAVSKTPSKTNEVARAVDIPAHPFLLTRLYEGKKPFLAIDQDALSHIFKPVIRIRADAPAEIRLGDLQKVGEPPNRNGMGIFVNPATGEKYYIKKTADAGKAVNEVLCAGLAGAFGVNVPKIRTFEEDGQHYVASEFIEGLVLANELFPNCAIDPRELVKVARACPDIHKAYVAATLLNNRDILGMGLDNLGFTRAADGALIPHFVDFGGSGAYRATAGRKMFDGDAKEFSSMTEPRLQADSHGGGPNGLVFGGIVESVLKESLDKILSVTDAELKALVRRHIADAEQQGIFFHTIIDRRNAIQVQLSSGTHDRFQAKLTEAVDYGISGAYEWDTEDPEMNARVRTTLGPQISAYCAENRHLMADGTGQIEIAAGVQALVAGLVDQLLIEKNGARLTWAEQRKLIRAAAEAEAASTAPS